MGLDRMVEVRMTKCLLILPERVIWKLPPEELMAAIKRGKHYRRAESTAKREKVNLSPWTDASS